MVIRTDPRIQKALSSQELQPAPTADFKSKASKWSTGTKVALGVVSILAAVVVVPVALLACGAFKRKLHVRQQGSQGNNGKGVNTQLTSADWKKVVKHAREGMDGQGLSALTEKGRRQQEQVRGLSMRIIKAACSAETFKGLEPTLESISGHDIARLARLVATAGPSVLDELQRVKNQELKQSAVPVEEMQQVGYYQANRSRLDKKLQMAPAAPLAPQAQPPSQQELNKKAVSALMADLVHSENPAEMVSLVDPSQRLRLVLMRHVDTVAMIARDPEVALEGWPEDKTKSIRDLTDAPLFRMLSSELPEGPLNEEQRNVARQLLKAAPDEKLREINQWVEQQVVSTLAGLDFKALIDQQFKGLDLSGVPRAFREFFDELLPNYVTKQTPLDQRVIVASVLRNSGPDSDPREMLVAGLKGCGPYMLKLLQNLCDKVSDEGAKELLQDVKDKLEPLNADLRKALLIDVIEQNNADPKSRFQVARLEDIHPFSAASVGEAVRAKIIYRPRGVPDDAPWSSKVVVIKLLRPGLAERAARERDYFVGVAEQIGKGMPENIKAISDQIDTELDLRREAANVVKGQVFSAQGGSMLRAMRDAEVIAPTRQVMVLEQAPGDTGKKFLKILKDPPADQNFDRLEQGAKFGDALAELSTAFFKEMIFGSGFVHGDLHSGNFLFRSQGGDSQLTLIDFGNCVTLSKPEQNGILLMGASAARRRSDIFLKEFIRQLPPESQAKLDDRVLKPAQDEDRAKSAAWQAAVEELGREDPPPTVRKILEVNFKRIINPPKVGQKKGDQVEWEAQQSVGDKILRSLELGMTLNLGVPSGIMNVARSMVMLDNTIADYNKIHKTNLEQAKERLDDLLDEDGGPLAQAGTKLNGGLARLFASQLAALSKSQIDAAVADEKAFQRGGVDVEHMSDEEVGQELVNGFYSSPILSMQNSASSIINAPPRLLALLRRVLPQEMREVDSMLFEVNQLRKGLAEFNTGSVNLYEDGPQGAARGIGPKMRAVGAMGIGDFFRIALRPGRREEIIKPEQLRPDADKQPALAAADLPPLQVAESDPKNAADRLEDLQQLQEDLNDADDLSDEIADQILAEMQNRDLASGKSDSPAWRESHALDVDQIVAKYGEVGGFRDSESMPDSLDLSAIIKARRVSVGGLVSQQQ